MTNNLDMVGTVDRFVRRRWPAADSNVLLYAVGLRYLHARPLPGDSQGQGGRGARGQAGSYFGFGPGLGAWPV